MKETIAVSVAVVFVVGLVLSAAVIGCQENEKTIRARIESQKERCKVLAEKGQYAGCFKESAYQ